MTAEMFDVISPVDETVLTAVRFADRAEMDARIARAHGAWDGPCG